MATTRGWRPGETLAVEGRPLGLVPMVVGYEPIPESLSVAGGSGLRWLMEPVTAVAVVFRDGWVLLDGGFDVDEVGDPAVRAAVYDQPNYTPVVPTADPLAEQVAAAGLDWAACRGAAVSHVHFDHTGAARLLPAGCPLLLQRREHDWLVGPTEAHEAVSPASVVRPGGTLLLLDGDTVLADGLQAIDTRGHTPGHQSFVVDLPDRRVVLACDAADLAENVARPCRCGSVVGADGHVLADAAAQRLHRLAAEPGTEVWPGHDPAFPVWRRVVDDLVAAERR